MTTRISFYRRSLFASCFDRRQGRHSRRFLCSLGVVCFVGSLLLLLLFLLFLLLLLLLLLWHVLHLSGTRGDALHVVSVFTREDEVAIRARNLFRVFPPLGVKRKECLSAAEGRPPLRETVLAATPFRSRHGG